MIIAQKMNLLYSMLLKNLIKMIDLAWYKSVLYLFIFVV